MPANSYLWELTTDNVHGKLWGSSDNTNINFYQFDIIGSKYPPYVTIIYPN